MRVVHIIISWLIINLLLLVSQIYVCYGKQNLGTKGTELDHSITKKVYELGLSNIK